jgi:hypothetical protein
MTWADISGGVYGFFFVSVAVMAGLGVLAKHAIHNLIEQHMGEIREELKRLDRIEYALYNDGQTGLINKVDALIENQQVIRVDVEVMKARTKQ